MAKVPCAICGKELGIFSGKAKVSDGTICSNCLNDSGVEVSINMSSYKVQTIKEFIKDRQKKSAKFTVTKSYANSIYLDETNKYFKIEKNIFDYDNLLSYELLEDGQSMHKGGLGRAVAGGLLFGGVGAIVGGVTGGKKTTGICNSMKLRISLKNAPIDVVYITFILSETKTKSFIYRAAQDSAQKCIAALEYINDINQHSQPQTIQVAPSTSSADEILKFKNLLDQGIITQEEFDSKKKELLGL